jgi:hypothetical protein
VRQQVREAGRVKVAQRFIAGMVGTECKKSAERTAELLSGSLFSVARFTGFVSTTRD